MVNAAITGFKPYVHSDCGGDYRGKVGGDLMRWAAHCGESHVHRTLANAVCARIAVLL